MTRGLLVVAGLVVLVAVGTTGYVMGRNSVTMPAPVVAPVVPEKVAVAPVKPVASAPTAAPTPAPTPAPAAPAATVSVSVSEVAQMWRDGKIPPEEMAQIIEALNYRDRWGLTKEDHQVIGKVGEAALAARRALPKADQKYWLPADNLLSDPNLNLTAEQKTNLQALKQTTKAKMDAALGGLQNQAAAWGAKQSEFFEEATQANGAVVSQPKAGALQSDGYKAWQADIQSIHEQMAAVTSQLNADYFAQARTLLTANQGQTLDAVQTLSGKIGVGGGVAGGSFSGLGGGLPMMLSKPKTLN